MKNGKRFFVMALLAVGGSFLLASSSLAAPEAAPQAAAMEAAQPEAAAPAAAAANTIAGTVVSVSADTLTLNQPASATNEEKQVAVQITPETKFEGVASLMDLSQEDKVNVEFKQDKDQIIALSVSKIIPEAELPPAQ